MTSMMNIHPTYFLTEPAFETLPYDMYAAAAAAALQEYRRHMYVFMYARIILDVSTEL